MADSVEIRAGSRLVGAAVQEAPTRESDAVQWPRHALPPPRLRAAEAVPDLTPWSIVRTHARPIAVAVAICLLALLTVELTVFRSGFFAAHVRLSNPSFATAKLALAARSVDARVLYVGDSTILTDVAPAIVSGRCECGPGFNGGFKAATPELTDALTRRVLALMHPRLVVIGMSPWEIGGNAKYDAGDLAREVLPPVDLYELSSPVDLMGTIDKTLGSVWSAYGQRVLIKEWLASLVPGQRYDEALRGLWIPPGSATSPVQLAAVGQDVLGGVKEPTPNAPGAIATLSLVDELRAQGIAVAMLVPPLHPAAYEQAAPYLDRADAVVRELAVKHSIPIIDCRSAVSAEDFRDFDHLIHAGAEKHSTCVGDQIRVLLGSDHAVQ